MFYMCLHSTIGHHHDGVNSISARLVLVACVGVPCSITSVCLLTARESRKTRTRGNFRFHMVESGLVERKCVFVCVECVEYVSGCFCVLCVHGGRF